MTSERPSVEVVGYAGGADPNGQYAFLVADCLGADGHYHQTSFIRADLAINANPSAYEIHLADENARLRAVVGNLLDGTPIHMEDRDFVTHLMGVLDAERALLAFASKVRDNPSVWHLGVSGTCTIRNFIGSVIIENAELREQLQNVSKEGTVL